LRERERTERAPIVLAMGAPVSRALHARRATTSGGTPRDVGWDCLDAHVSDWSYGLTARIRADGAISALLEITGRQSSDSRGCVAMVFTRRIRVGRSIPARP